MGTQVSFVFVTIRVFDGRTDAKGLHSTVCCITCSCTAKTARLPRIAW